MTTRTAPPQPYQTAAAFARSLTPPVTRQTVTDWCRAGLIPGAYQSERGGYWFIPRGAARPALRTGRPRRITISVTAETSAENA